MPTTDYTYRLDTSDSAVTPVNTVGGGHLISGGSPTKVSLGGGKNYWRFDGSSLASAAVPSRTTNMSSAGGGVTIAFRVRLISYPALYAFMFGYVDDTAGANGPHVRNAAGASGSTTTYSNVSGSLNGPGTITVGAGAFQTVVMRVAANDPLRSSSDYLDIWTETVGRSGTAPNRTNTAGAVGSNHTLDTLAFNAGTDIYVEQFVIYAGEKTDAECAALADDIYAALTPPSALSGGATLGDVTASGGMGPEPASEISGGATLGDLTASGSMGMAPGVITTPVLKNNTGTILAGVANVVANVYHPTTGVLIVRKTGLSSDGSGIVTITDAALVPGTTYAYEIDLSATTQGRRLPTGVAS